MSYTYPYNTVYLNNEVEEYEFVEWTEPSYGSCYMSKSDADLFYRVDYSTMSIEEIYNKKREIVLKHCKKFPYGGYNLTYQERMSFKIKKTGEDSAANAISNSSRNCFVNLDKNFSANNYFKNFESVYENSFKLISDENDNTNVLHGNLEKLLFLSPSQAIIKDIKESNNEIFNKISEQKNTLLSGIENIINKCETALNKIFNEKKNEITIISTISIGFIAFVNSQKNVIGNAFKYIEGQASKINSDRKQAFEKAKENLKDQWTKILENTLRAFSAPALESAIAYLTSPESIYGEREGEGEGEGGEEGGCEGSCGGGCSSGNCGSCAGSKGCAGGCGSSCGGGCNNCGGCKCDSNGCCGTCCSNCLGECLQKAADFKQLCTYWCDENGNCLCVPSDGCDISQCISCPVGEIPDGFTPLNCQSKKIPCELLCNNFKPISNTITPEEYFSKPDEEKNNFIDKNSIAYTSALISGSFDNNKNIINLTDNSILESLEVDSMKDPISIIKTNSEILKKAIDAGIVNPKDTGEILSNKKEYKLGYITSALIGKNLSDIAINFLNKNTKAKNKISKNIIDNLENPPIL